MDGLPVEYRPTWDLDSIFPGGSASPQLAEAVARLEEDALAMRERFGALEPPRDAGEAAAWAARIADLCELFDRFGQVAAFLGCLMAQDVRDERARSLFGRVAQAAASLEAAAAGLDARLAEAPDEVFAAILAEPASAGQAFALAERRRLARERMRPEFEALAGDLAVDGYHGWGTLRDRIAGRLEVRVEEGGEVRRLSAAQAENRMEHPDRAVRQAVFAAWEEAWGREADLVADALNHLAGFRLNLYRHRGWDELLKEPLAQNRMTRATLDAMWEAVDLARPRLRRYLAAKARLLGVPALAWFDVPAPVGQGGRPIPYAEAATFVVRHLGEVHPALGRFAEEAFARRWIEAEDRPGKEPGGFCTTFPLTRESRVFLTYGGTIGGVGTLAHELGHAYHAHVVRELPTLARDYPMALAETASTFAESVVRDAALAQAADDAERLSLLDDRLASAAQFLMNIRARFLFETRFYEARRLGPLTPAELDELMLAAQREAYAEALSVYHPRFWAAKGHFYITGAPFYNFPYTFGYLFSLGAYRRLREKGAGLADAYDALLLDTGRMTVEELARRHLGAELAEPDFWREAVDEALADLPAYEALAAAGAGRP
ncbi:MAG: M3 family oligoendopeptidase [Clostridia bacterium]|nr:M3 family oligoendopeptidase [Clostridia bacterium]